MYSYRENVYYTDTDCAVLNKRLPLSEVGDNLGEVKLEYDIIKKGLFISPKLYYLLLENGDEIIMKAKSISQDTWILTILFFVV